LANKKSKFALSWLSRWRWNVLDLIQVCNRGAIATYLFCDIDMSWAEHLRKELSKRSHKVTVTAIIIKAIAVAQLKHPESRSAFLPWGRVVRLDEIEAGFTAERLVEGEPIVYFGSIKSPHEKTLEEIARELRNYAEKDFSEIRQLDIEHRFAQWPWLLRRFILWLGVRFPTVRLMCMGQTFGVSSLGKYGMKMIIPPCVTTSTFGVGSVESRPVVRGGEIVIRPMTSMTLNFDHRAIDGAPAARFLNDVRLLLEGGLNEYLTATERLVDPQKLLEAPSAILNSLGNVVLQADQPEKIPVG
jgi:hypothetical protein